MKTIKPILLVIAGIFFLALSENLKAQSFSGWMGDNRNGTVEGFNVPGEWPAQLTKIWNIPVGESDASPVLLDGKMYLHVKRDNNEIAICIDPKNGKELWSTVLNQAPEVGGPAAGHPGPRSTPAISSGKLFTLGAGGAVNCLDAETGKIIWSSHEYKEVPQFFTSASPLVVDNKCIAQLGGKENGVVVAFDVNSGKEIWKLEDVPCTYASPVKMNTHSDLLLVQSETDLVGVSLQGKQLWKIATPAQGRNTNSVSPIYNDNVLLATGQGSGTKAYNLAGNNTSLLWTNKELGTSFNTPIIKNGFIFGQEERLGKIFCLDLKNGETKWQDETTLNRFASILDLGSVLASLSANGYLILFEPNSKEYVELAKYKITDNESYSHPIFAKNLIYTKDKETLTCWSVD